MTSDRERFATVYPPSRHPVYDGHGPISSDANRIVVVDGVEGRYVAPMNLSQPLRFEPLFSFGGTHSQTAPTPMPRPIHRSSTTTAQPTSQHSHPICLTDDSAKKAALSFLEKNKGQMNLLTQKTELPCDLVSLTRMRLQSDALIAALSVHGGSSIELTDWGETTFNGEKAPAEMSQCYSGLSPLDVAGVVANEAQNKKMHGHEQIVKFVKPMGLTNEWLQLSKDISSGEWARRAKVVQTYIDAKEAMEKITFTVCSSAAQMRLFEWHFQRLMYPKSAADVRFLLHIYDIVDLPMQCSTTNTVTGCPKCNAGEDAHEPPPINQTVITMPSLGTQDDETCVLCTERDTTKQYVRITPRCTMHDKCMDSRYSDSQCKCKNKYFHLDCLVSDMTMQYTGERNGGVGKSLLACPLCRGSYCFMDLTVFQIDDLSSADKSLKRAVTVEEALDVDDAAVRKSRRVQRSVEEGVEVIE